MAGLTINQQTEAYGNQITQAVQNNDEDRIDTLVPEITLWLERFRNEGLFLREGLSITYTGRQLLGLIQIAIAAEEIKTKYAYLWRLVNSTLIFIAKLFNEFQINEGYCVSVGPRWKNPQWEKNIHGCDVYLYLLGLMKSVNNPWTRLRLKDRGHPFWDQKADASITKLFDLMNSDDFNPIYDRIRLVLENNSKPTGRIAYDVYWDRTTDLLTIYSPELPLVSDEDSKPGFKGLNLLYYIQIRPNGTIVNIEYHRRITKAEAINLPITNLSVITFNNHLGPDSQPFPIYEFEDNKDSGNDTENGGVDNSIKDTMLKHLATLRDLVNQL